MSGYKENIPSDDEGNENPDTHQDVVYMDDDLIQQMDE